jgi:hypothetical protein
MCPENSKCINKLGGFDCECLFGFFKNYQNQCEDIDECNSFIHNSFINESAMQLEPTVCPKNFKCTNKPGSYDCVCNIGYRLNAKSECEGF